MTATNMDLRELLERTADTDFRWRSPAEWSVILRARRR
jgi:hypothetical protein